MNGSRPADFIIYIDAVDAEVGVLEVAEDAQVDRHPEQQPALRRLGAYTGGTNLEADPVVPQRDGREQRQEVHSPPGVEHVAGNQQQQIAIALPAQIVQAEKDRQEQKQEHIGRENHPDLSMFNQQSRARAPPNPPTMSGEAVIVPTLCVGMPLVALCATLWDAQRPVLHSHAERGNDQRLAAFVAFFMRRVVDLGQVTAQAEGLERLHAMLAFDHIRCAGVEGAEGLKPGKFHVFLEVLHVLLFAVLLLEDVRVFHPGQHLVAQALERAVVFPGAGPRR